MLNEELAIATIKEVRRQAAQAHRSEKAQRQAKRPSGNLLVRSIRYLPLPSLRTAPAL
ncbi:MAG: hypothetical protein IIB88_07870 [Chloroflexi bacterium]|nr:hypothetical protein [Chloroflexota bacterium]